MNPVVALKERVDGIPGNHSNNRHVDGTPGQPTILVATADPAIRVGLTELLQAFSIETIWAQGVEAAKRILAKERIAACFCGFWLQDGAYRELVRHIRRERMEIPVIIAAAPALPEEYRQYLAAMNLGALDFLCFPYRKMDLEKMLQLALEPYTQNIQSMRKKISAIDPMKINAALGAHA